MDIGHRITSLREQKKLSQGDIEKRTGLLRCYISRVENGHTVPAIETLEKIARALEMPLYQLMYDGSEPPALPSNGGGKRTDEWGYAGKDARFLKKLCRFLAAMSESDRQLLLSSAEKVPHRRKKSTPEAQLMEFRRQHKSWERTFFLDWYWRLLAYRGMPARAQSSRQQAEDRGRHGRDLCGIAVGVERKPRVRYRQTSNERREDHCAGRCRTFALATLIS